MERQLEYVLRTVSERGVRFIRLWFTDVLGFLKSFAITPHELESAFEEGLQFDGSAIEGVSRHHEWDMIAKPDPRTFALLPWRPGDQPVARMFCDILAPDGQPFAGDPRGVLQRQLQSASEHGYAFFVAPELEFFYSASSERLEPLDRGGYFDLTPLDVASDLRRSTITALESMGIPVEYSHHEVAPSQHEIDLRWSDALTMADNVMTFRLAVKEVAMEKGLHASFMPKPIAEEAGSAMHTHVSLFSDGENAFYDPDDEIGLSAVGRSFVAGLLHYAGDMSALTNQWVNSYKRLAGGFEAPTRATWGRRDATALVRVPSGKPTKPSSARVEFRAPDSACNPYLVFAVMLAAGLDGVAQDMELPAEVPSDSPSASQHGHPLPQSLHDAITTMELSELIAETLGTDIFEWLLRNKRREWDAYQRHVSEFELDRYFEVL